MSEQEKLREALLNKLPRLMSHGKQWVPLDAVVGLGLDRRGEKEK